MKIFVSYSSKDYDAVEKIIEPLIEHGYEVWIDRQQLKPADNMMLSIQKGINEADIVIAFITDNYNNSSYASIELGAVWLEASASKLLAIVIGETNIPSFMYGVIFKKYEMFSPDITNDIIMQLKNIDSYIGLDPTNSEERIKIDILVK